MKQMRVWPRYSTLAHNNVTPANTKLRAANFRAWKGLGRPPPTTTTFRGDTTGYITPKKGHQLEQHVNQRATTRLSFSWPVFHTNRDTSRGMDL